MRQLGHFEHVHGRLAVEQLLQRRIRLDQARVALGLQLVLLDVLPQLADHVGARHGRVTDDRRQLGLGREWLPERGLRVSTLHVLTSLDRPRDWPANNSLHSQLSAPPVWYSVTRVSKKF